MLLIDEIEAIWHKIDTDDNWSLFHQKIESIHEMRNVLVDEDY